MSTIATFSDDQWYTLLDSMHSRQEPGSMQQQQLAAHQAPLRQPGAQHEHASDQAFADLNAMNFNSSAADNFDSEPDFANFAHPQPTPHQVSLGDFSLVQIQRIAKEMEGVKQRLDARCRQMDKLSNNVNMLFSCVNEIRPFLMQTQNMLKEAVSVAGHPWTDTDDQNSQPDQQATLGVPLESMHQPLDERRAGRCD